jgi:hypothetical protein
MNDLRSLWVIEKIKPIRAWIQDRLHEVEMGCRNPRERCDAAFLKKSRTVRSSRVPENFLGKVPGKFPGKLFWERSRKYFLCARNFLEKFSPGKSMHAIQISKKKAQLKSDF